jgi:aldehyde dehydrogenase (NAD+)
MINPIDKSYKLFIDGNWIDGTEGKTFTSYCPASGEALSTCVDAGKEDVNRAVTAAWKAYESWKDVSPQERARMLNKIADLIDANAEKLAMVETLDNGKPIRETTAIDVPLSSDHFRYFASAIRTEEGQAVMIDKDTMSIILREPIGVVGQIIPWNFPLLMGAWKIAPALAAGDCVVIKPSSMTSLSLLELAKLLAEVLPPGVVNVITGRGSVSGNYILEHEGFRKLAFTGSTEVGYTISGAAAKRLIPATLELGGKSANIYFPDAPWDKAIEGLQIGILFNQGQVCCAGSRAFVHEDIYDKFLEEAVKAFGRVKVGLPWEKDTQMGSQVSEDQLRKILAYVEVGRKEGAKIACGDRKSTRLNSSHT